MAVDKHACEVVNLESLCKKYGDKLAYNWLRVLVNMTGFITRQNLPELLWSRDI